MLMIAQLGRRTPADAWLLNPERYDWYAVEFVEISSGGGYLNEVRRGNAKKSDNMVPLWDLSIESSNIGKL
ncbi:hypothetical protein C5167_011984 [Papaver somniferum]|uniref:Uncharacterized protein n=1 Tax=Papaver somniferum TaxID=3469 RepID=A0A4Y7IW62_PAPSO|nr:hypothetical protein C5167_011984 [Papaver somniferum]